MFFCVVCPAGFAHTLQQTTTEITWHPDTHWLEVVHSVHLDDALQLMADLGDPNGNLNVEMQAKLLLYLETAFNAKQGKNPLMFEPVGAQIEGDYLWLYQQAQVLTYPMELAIEIKLLHGYYPVVHHQINFSVGGQVQTLHLNREQNQGIF